MREALEEAIEYADSIGGMPLTLIAAARKQLALMPEKCGTCGGSGEFRSAGYADATRFAGWYPCGDCVSGKVYPQEVVEQLADIIGRDRVPPHERAVAVLDALGGKE